jgi:arylsulfatase A-like enzyme
MPPSLPSPRSRRSAAVLLSATLLAALFASPAVHAAEAHRSPPNVLVVSIDTLRADHLSGYGYPRPTSPAIDRLLAAGARFDEARTVEPLTSPAAASMLTSLHPHEHGSTRNGVSLRRGLPSLPKELDRSGYQTAAFIANWTLKNTMSGLGEHFQGFQEVLTRKRWLGLVAGEATAEDVNEAAVAWLDEHAGRRRPFFVWVHYVEPHAPYEFQGEVAARLGLRDRSETGRIDRYDTEVAFVDHYVGELVRRIEDDPALAGNTLVVVTADHGESLGEHGYWGHGRRLFEPGLHIPLVFYWPGRLEPRRLTAPASILDVAPTILGLLGHDVPPTFRGFDWAPVLTAGAEPPSGRTFGFQAHKGAVVDGDETARSRSKGLIAVGLLRDGEKEILHMGRRVHQLFDLDRDADERKNLRRGHSQPSAELQLWRQEVEEGLMRADDEPLPHLDDEAVEKLKALGYLDG